MGATDGFLMGTRQRDEVSAGAGSTDRAGRGRATSKTRKSAETRERIMQAATELMSEHGSADFQMSEVSERCNMSKGSLYYYFVDKDDLVDTVFKRAAKQLVASIEQVVEGSSSAGEALRGICMEYMGRVGAGSPVAMALMRELMRSGDQGPTSLGESLERIVEILAHELELAKDEGVVRRDVDCRLAALSLCGALTFVAVNMLGRGQGGMVDIDFSDRLLEQAFVGLGVPEEEASELVQPLSAGGRLA